MTPEFAISLAAFVVVFVVLNRLVSATPTGYEEDPNLELARRAIRSKIDEHGDALAERYREVCAQDTRDGPVPGSFAREIEGFIGRILLPEIEFEHPGLGRALREVVTLERERIYSLVLSRVRPA
jgi:hypothetical protein